MLEIFFVTSSSFLSVPVTSFSIGIVNGMYFLMFSACFLNYFLISFANSFYNKMMVIIRSIMKSYRTFFSYKIYKLHMLCAAPI